MKIAIDARWIFRDISGIGAYTRELIRHLSRIGRSHSYVLIFNEPALCDRTFNETGIRECPAFSDWIFPHGVFSPLSQLLMPGRLASRGIDLYHSPNYMIPLLAFPKRQAGRTKCVVTIHDVIPLIFPDHAPRSRKARVLRLYRRLMIDIAARADAIITDSQASRADTVEHLQIPPSRAGIVKAVYCGVSDRFRPPAERAARRPAETRRVLYVGRSDPYKNVATLIRAFAEAKRACPFPMSLTLAGTPDPRYPEARRLAVSLGIHDAVRWTGYVSDDALVALYREADVLVHPSRYEGFGLQVAEAMACGLPVVCSSAGALPEVAGDAAILLSPDDTQGFAREMARVLTDPALAANLSRKGIRQSAAFSWSCTAERTLRIYEELAP